MYLYSCSSCGWVGEHSDLVTGVPDGAEVESYTDLQEFMHSACCCPSCSSQASSVDSDEDGFGGGGF